MTADPITHTTASVRTDRRTSSRVADIVIIGGATLWTAGLLLPSASWTVGGAGPRVSGPSVVAALLGAPLPDGALPSSLLLWCSTILAVLALAVWLTARLRVAVAIGVSGSLLALAWANDLGSLPALASGPLGWYEDVRVEPAAWLLSIGLWVITVGFLVAAESAWATRQAGGVQVRPSWFAGSAYLIVGGLVLWSVAQFLPAFTSPELLGEGSDTTIGLSATLLAWDLALLGGSLAIGIAWTANIWFALALASRWRHHASVALVFALVAVACSAVGILVLLSGGLPDSGWGSVATVTSVGIGSWLWFASTVLVFAGTAASALVIRTSAAAAS